MLIENTNTAMSIWVKNLVSTIVLTVSLILIYMVHLLKEPVLGVGQLEATIFLCTLYLFLVLPTIILKYQFTYFSLEENKLSVKYYTIGFIPGAKKSFEFHASEFYKYELGRSLFNLRESIIIFRKVKKGIAKYPPISLTGLKEKQRNQVITLFTSLSKAPK
ncbi:MAG: hypothetical protein U9N53_00680 [Bacteroidota bacterium]|nr:hypothetical protein [Bacteroidota bacterium]